MENPEENPEHTALTRSPVPCKTSALLPLLRPEETLMWKPRVADESSALPALCTGIAPCPWNSSHPYYKIGLRIKNVCRQILLPSLIHKFSHTSCRKDKWEDIQGPKDVSYIVAGFAVESSPAMSGIFSCYRAPESQFSLWTVLVLTAMRGICLNGWHYGSWIYACMYKTQHRWERGNSFKANILLFPAWSSFHTRILPPKCQNYSFPFTS